MRAMGSCRFLLLRSAKMGVSPCSTEYVVQTFSFLVQAVPASACPTCFIEKSDPNNQATNRIPPVVLSIFQPGSAPYMERHSLSIFLSWANVLLSNLILIEINIFH